LLIYRLAALRRISEEDPLVENAELTTETVETSLDEGDAVKPAKKKFVPPVISVPVDVLEATTFFQAADSGIVVP
jgi:hypothetical protein